MNASARFLVLRLVAIQGSAWAVTGLLAFAFAPPLLLLSDAVVQGSARVAAWGWASAFVLVVVSSWALVRPLRGLLGSLSRGEGPVDPTDVHRLYAAPARLVAVGFTATSGVAVATLLPAFRPVTNDPTTQFELVLLLVTMASVATLPAYVAMRDSVARVLELVAVGFSRGAIERLGPRDKRAPIHHRLLAAVVAPVALVALGAALLVHAHLRASDMSARQRGAAELALGVFDAVGDDDDVRGRREAAIAARALGMDVLVLPTRRLFSVVTRDDGWTELTVPLADGHARMTFVTARLSPWNGVYAGLAILATLVAGALGYRLGRALAEDVALATEELGTTGVADVLRGERLRGKPRFESVAELMSATDALGAVFREFARAQQRAIDAGAATERTRGLFLASMSHDLKAPLNAILGFTELVSRNVLTSEQRQSVAIISRRGRELLYLIDTILDAARVEAGELTIAPHPAYLNDVVMAAVLDARELSEAAPAHIVADIESGCPPLMVDRARLAQALTAILLVAVRFAERGEVVVRAAMHPPGLRIAVEAVSREAVDPDREKVFEAFKHADRVRRHGSLGLGPALARAIVELHGGGVALETQGGRIVFNVVVPDRAEAVTSSRAPGRPAS